jgi:hypothetical protein
VALSIFIRLPGHRIRRWHNQFRHILQDAAHTRVYFNFQKGSDLNRSIELLLALEKLIYFKSGQSTIDLLSPGLIDDETTPNSDETVADPATDIVIDLSGAHPGAAGKTITALFDGQAGEHALLGALLEGRAPVIEISGAGGQILSRATPALDEARCIREGFERTVAVVQAMLIRAIVSPKPVRALPPATKRAEPHGIQIGRYAVNKLASLAIRRAYQLCMFSPHWRVGWRYLSDQRGVWERQTLDGVPWTSIRDPGFRFFADPFPFSHEGKTFVFVEDYDHHQQKGVISAIPFDAESQVGPAQAVLSEPWHLSYPFVFEHNGAAWMIPESSQARKIPLYRAEMFPSRWVHEADLVSDLDAFDASIVQFGGKWWIFATVRDASGGAMDSLAIFYADSLLGRWSPHPKNPVLIDAAGARQGGHFVEREGKLWRPVQDCRRGYGRALGLAEVTTLSENDFAQEIRTVIHPGRSWPGRRLHTLNRFGRLECIDGSRNSFRFASSLFAVTRASDAAGNVR